MGELLTICWPSHQQRLCEGICRLYRDKMGMDFDICLTSEKDSTADSNLLKAHSLVLQVFCQAATNCDGKQIKLDDAEINKEDVRCLLEFMYRGETQVEVERLNVVKKTAEKFGLDVFTEVIDLIKINKPSTKYKQAIAEHDYVLKDETNNPEKILNEEIGNINNGNLSDFLENEKEDFNSIEKITISNDISLNSDERLAFFPEKVSDDINFIKKIPSSNEVSESSSRSSGDCEYDLSSQVTKSVSNLSQQIVGVSEPRMRFKKSGPLNCPICDKRLKDRYYFRNHVRSHPESNFLIKCPRCPFMGWEIEEHLANRHKRDGQGNFLKNTIKCDDCDFVCDNNSRLKEHKIVKHTAPTVKCDQCPYVCHTKSYLNRHKSNVHVELWCYECEICGVNCKTRVSLNKHKTIHSGKVVCEFCGIQLSIKALSRYTKTHKSGANYKFKCTWSECKFRSRDRFNLKVHFKNIHKLTNEEINELLKSDSIFLTETESLVNEEEINSQLKDGSGLKKPLKKYRRPKKKIPIICEVCGVVVSCKGSMYRHLKTHRHSENKNVYKCPMCDYNPAERYNLKAHFHRKHKFSDDQINSLMNNIPIHNSRKNVQVDCPQ